MASATYAFRTDGVPPPARAKALHAAIEQAFPGMRVPHVSADPYARLGCTKLARCAIFELETSQKGLEWSPSPRGRPELYVLLTVRGEALVSHAGREARLASENFAFIDSRHPFELSVSDDSSHVLLQLPQDLVRLEGRFAEDALARASSHAEAGDLYLARALHSLAATAPSMSPSERAIAEHAVVGLLSLASVARRDPPAFSLWLRRAFEVLDAHALVSDFDAGALAETLGVSRRYLDRLFAQAGTTASREIWGRRLRWATDALRSPHDAHRTILDIALSAGFSDAAHFSRAFRRRFGYTASEWRNGKETRTDTRRLTR